MVFQKMATKSKFATKFTVTKSEVDCNSLQQMKLSNVFIYRYLPTFSFIFDEEIILYDNNLLLIRNKEIIIIYTGQCVKLLAKA